MAIYVCVFNISKHNRGVWIFCRLISCSTRDKLNPLDGLLSLTPTRSDWLTDWLTDWTHWLTGWLTDWLTDWTTHALTHSLTYSLAHSLTHTQADIHTDWYLSRIYLPILICAVSMYVLQKSDELILYHWQTIGYDCVCILICMYCVCAFV